MNLKDKKQRTSVYCAALNDDVKIVEMLVAKGAKCDVRDIDGRQVVHQIPVSKFVSLASRNKNSSQC